MAKIKETIEHHQNISKKLMLEIQKKKENIEQSESKREGNGFDNMKTENEFLKKLNKIKIEKIDSNTKRYFLQKHLLVTIKKDSTTNDIIETNIVISDDFEFCNNRYHIFLNNKKKDNELINLLNTDIKQKYTKFPMFNQLLAKFIESLLFDNFKKEKLNEFQTIKLLHKIFFEINGLFSLLKYLVLQKQVRFVSFNKKGIIRFRFKLLKLGIAEIVLSFILKPDGEWHIDSHILKTDTDQFLFPKLEMELKKLISQKIDNNMNHQLWTTKKKISKLINSIKDISWSHIDYKKAKKPKVSRNKSRSKSSTPRN
jgi:hypothetical protein